MRGRELRVRWFPAGYRFSKLLLLSFLTVILLTLMLVLTLAWRSWSPSVEPGLSLSGISLVVYKSPECQCCLEYIGYLRGLGASVLVRDVSLVELEALKRALGVPEGMESCHTGVIENLGYFIEGHVPGEAIVKLVEEKPVARGVTLPGMPPGSPGMPGVKTGAHTVYLVEDGRISPFWQG